MHTKTHYKASEWDQFNESMHELVQQSNKLVEMSVIGRGSYCFCKSYMHLEVDQQQWMHMTTKQREIWLTSLMLTLKVKIVNNLLLKLSLKSLDPSILTFQYTNLAAFRHREIGCSNKAICYRTLKVVWFTTSLLPLETLGAKNSRYMQPLPYICINII